jgi:hypothetical protein
VWAGPASPHSSDHPALAPAPMVVCASQRLKGASEQMERSYTTTDPWTYRDNLGVEMSRGLELTGFEVEAHDGGIGKIDGASYDLGSSYIVVDTGPWIFGTKVMLPAAIIQRIASIPRLPSSIARRTRSRTPRSSTNRSTVRSPTGRVSGPTTTATGTPEPSKRTQPEVRTAAMRRSRSERRGRLRGCHPKLSRAGRTKAFGPFYRFGGNAPTSGVTCGRASSGTSRLRLSSEKQWPHEPIISVMEAGHQRSEGEEVVGNVGEYEILGSRVARNPWNSGWPRPR